MGEWIVGCVYKGEIKPFYITNNFILARRMFLMLLDMGYINVATNAYWSVESTNKAWINQ